MLAVVGETATVTEVGCVGCVGVVAVFEPELQEASARARRDTSRNRKRGRSAEDIARIVSDGKEGGGNWTVGQKWGRGKRERDVDV